MNKTTFLCSVIDACDVAKHSEVKVSDSDTVGKVRETIVRPILSLVHVDAVIVVISSCCHACSAILPACLPGPA